MHDYMRSIWCWGFGEDEIVTWEPDWDNFLEYDREWVDDPVVLLLPSASFLRTTCYVPLHSQS